MNYWLMKSEPGEWSWGDQVAEGGAGAEWDGIRNYQARNNMQDMRLGDLVFFYHSVNEKRIVGVVEVSAVSHPDSTDSSGVWTCVDVRAVRPFPKPVTLADIRGEPRLANMMLVKNSRLSVQPVTEEEWQIVCGMGDYVR